MGVKHFPKRYVRVNDVTYMLSMDDKGIRIIYKRCPVNQGHPYLEGYVNVAVWHRDHSKGTGPRTVPGKIIAMLRDEDVKHVA